MFFEAGLLLEEATLGGNLLPFFPINSLKGAVLRIPDAPSRVFQLFWVKKNCFREENLSRGASVTLPRGFRKQIRESFPPLFTVLHPFFVLQRVSFQIELFNSFYVPVVVPICFVYFYSRFIYFPYPLLTCFSHLFNSFRA